MAQIEGFNSEEFAKNLTGQAKEVIPADLPKQEKEFIANILYRFCVLAGDALIKDETVNINAQQASIIAQFIGEWTFHKSIDLIRSGVPQDKRDPILQKVAFAVFEESRDVIVNNVDQNEAIARVENAVSFAYDEAINEMMNQNQLDGDLANKARNESNIDKMAQEAVDQEQAEMPPEQQGQAPPPQQAPAQSQQNTGGTSPKLIKLAAVAMLLKRMDGRDAKAVLSRFAQRDQKAIQSYMSLEGLEEAFDMKLIKDFMHDFLMTIPKEAQAYATKLARKKYTDLTQSVPEQELQNILGRERLKIRETINDSKKLNQIPSKISNIVYNYLNDKVAK